MRYIKVKASMASCEGEGVLVRAENGQLFPVTKGTERAGQGDAFCFVRTQAQGNIEGFAYLPLNTSDAFVQRDNAAGGASLAIHERNSEISFDSFEDALKDALLDKPVADVSMSLARFGLAFIDGETLEGLDVPALKRVRDVACGVMSERRLLDAGDEALAWAGAESIVYDGDSRTVGDSVRHAAGVDEPHAGEGPRP